MTEDNLKQKPAPTFSVGIPVYNEEKNIKNLLLSIEKQSGGTLEKIIVFEDKSTDGTLKVIKELISKSEWLKDKIVLIESKHNCGKSCGLKEIFSRNTSEFLILFDSDAVLEDRKVVEKLISPFYSNKNLGLTSGWYFFLPGRYAIQKVFEFSSVLLKEVGRYKPVYSSWGAVMCLKRENLEKISMPKGITRVDAFIYLETIKNGYDYQFCPDVQVLDKKDFSSFSLSQYLRYQKRGSFYPDFFYEHYGEEFMRKATSVGLGVKFLSFFRSFIEYPIRGTYYTVFKTISVLNNIFGRSNAVDYLWRK